ncbi:MAG: hypothetical protein V1915_02365 [Candidatus Bathyarchaeota archaeon]
MTFAYTSGLKRKRSVIIRKTRRLPLPGEVLVKKGDKVSYDTEVARVLIPGKFEVVPAYDDLGVNQESAHLEKYMFKKIGDPVERGEILAHRQTFFGLINYTCISPTTGTIEHIADVSTLPGQVVIREPPTPRSIYSYIPGTVVEILPKEGAIIETVGSFIQGIFGIGREAHGEICLRVDASDSVLTAEMIEDSCRGKVIIGGASVETKALQKAVEVGVSGIVVGGIKDKDLTTFLGYEIGVAITGQEDVGLTLILTEGFGKVRMAQKSFELLKSCEGQIACINGATQIRASVIRPEIIIPTQVEHNEIVEKPLFREGLTLGLPIRVVVPPYFGALGRIVSLPESLQTLEIESKVRVLHVELDNGQTITVPRANVEVIED